MIIESIDSWLTDFCKRLGLIFQNKISWAFFIKFLYMCILGIIIWVFFIPNNFILNILKLSFQVEVFSLIIDLIVVLISDQFKIILKKESLTKNLIIIFIKDMFLLIIYFLSIYYYPPTNDFIFEIFSAYFLIFLIIGWLIWIGFTAWFITKMVDGYVKKVTNKIIQMEHLSHEKSKRVLRLYVLLILILFVLFFFVGNTYLILDIVLPYKWGDLYPYRKDDTIGRWFGVMISSFVLSILFAIIVSLYFVFKRKYNPSIIKILLVNVFFITYFYIKFIFFVLSIETNQTYDIGSIIISLLILIYGIGKLGVDFKEVKFFNTLIFVLLFIAYGNFITELLINLSTTQVESYIINAQIQILFSCILCFLYILYHLIKKSMKLCKSCGVKYDFNKEFCEQCGVKLVLA